MAAFLFMRNMIQFTNVTALTKDIEDNETGKDNEGLANFVVPQHVEVFEITGPLFFGAAYKFKDAMRYIEKPPKVLIIRMRYVPIIDATGIKTIEEVYRDCVRRDTKLVLSEVHSQQVRDGLKEARLLFAIGKANVQNTFEEALTRSEQILASLAGNQITK